MNTQTLKDIIPQDFTDESRVWIYQSNRPFSDKEVLEINEQLSHFATQWNAHGAPVKGWGEVLFHQFIVLMADETDIKVSGCSTDSSVRIIKSLERQYSINLFDRLTLTFLVKDKAEMLPLHQVQYALDKGFLTADTQLFNNMVQTKGELMDSWLIALKDSWLAKRINLASA